MKTIKMQRDGGHWTPVFDEDKKESKEYMEKQIVEFKPKTVGVKKLRSIKQLGTYWGYIGTLVRNTVRFEQKDDGLHISVVRAQRIYNNHRWPNPIGAKLANVEPAR